MGPVCVRRMGSQSEGRKAPGHTASARASSSLKIRPGVVGTEKKENI